MAAQNPPGRRWGVAQQDQGSRNLEHLFTAHGEPRVERNECMCTSFAQPLLCPYLVQGTNQGNCDHSYSGWALLHQLTQLRKQTTPKGPEKWLWQWTQVQFPTPTLSGSQFPGTPAAGNSLPFPVLHIYVAYIQTNTYT